MELWAGDITLDEPSIKYHDIRIFSPELVSPPFSSATKLHFLSLVDTAQIPLYLVAGPSFSVWSENELTEDWLADSLLPQEFNEHYSGLSQGQQAQLNNGILLRLHGHQLDTVRFSSAITELLLYAVVSPSTAGACLPTPPRSSSPHAALEQLRSTSAGGPVEAKVYALPLSSDRCYMANSPLGIHCTTSAGAHQPQIFSDTQQPFTTETPLSRKRSKLSSIFDEAQQQRRRLKGGEGVAKIMAGTDVACGQSEAIKLEDQDCKGVKEMDTHTHQCTGTCNLSRMPSVSSVPDYDLNRPRSGRDNLTSDRSTLGRVASTPVVENGSPNTESASYIEEQNKTALTRVVMAGMRLFGLQQQKKGSRSRAASVLPCASDSVTNPIVSSESDDTYKLVYHQTFKAAWFTFRAHLATTLISQDTMRDVVDRFLSIFCTDPFSSHLLGQGQATGLPLSKVDNVFDAPTKV